MLKPTQNGVLYLRVFGKFIRITQAFATDKEANDYMAANPGEGVIDLLGNVVLLARNDDLGVKGNGAG